MHSNTHMQRRSHARCTEGVEEGKSVQLCGSAAPSVNAGKASGKLGPIGAAVSNEK